jgi:hypothetical protein
MKKAISLALAVVLVGVLAGAALAEGPGWGPMMGARGAMMGGGRAMMGARMGPMTNGPEACPMQSAGAAGAEAVTEERAKELAAEYVNRYFTGFTLERVLPVTGRFHTMYRVELRGPKGETRYLHVTPWGGVRPSGPLAATN